MQRENEGSVEKLIVAVSKADTCPAERRGD
jgi:hypothetical protein